MVHTGPRDSLHEQRHILLWHHLYLRQGNGWPHCWRLHLEGCCAFPGATVQHVNHLGSLEMHGGSTAGLRCIGCSEIIPRLREFGQSCILRDVSARLHLFVYGWLLVHLAVLLEISSNLPLDLSFDIPMDRDLSKGVANRVFVTHATPAPCARYRPITVASCIKKFKATSPDSHGAENPRYLTGSLDGQTSSCISPLSPGCCAHRLWRPVIRQYGWRALEAESVVSGKRAAPRAWTTSRRTRRTRSRRRAPARRRRGLPSACHISARAARQPLMPIIATIP